MGQTGSQLNSFSPTGNQRWNWKFLCWLQPISHIYNYGVTVSTLKKLGDGPRQRRCHYLLDWFQSAFKYHRDGVKAVLLEIPVCGGILEGFHISIQSLWKHQRGNLTWPKYTTYGNSRMTAVLRGIFSFGGGPAVTLLPGDKQKSVVDGTNRLFC